MQVEGDLHPFMANLLYFKDVIAPHAGGQTMSPQYEAIAGRYLRCNLLGEPHRLYIEKPDRAFLCFACTRQGLDTRQYRGLLNDSRITKDSA